ncbi:MAG: NusG domain II-containing protein [Candidatus Delongbacteria bacterium]
MSTRRDFLKSALVGGAALGLGFWGGFEWKGQAPDGPWELAARVPEGEEDALRQLAARLGLELESARWQDAPLSGDADLALLRGGRLLDPAQWPAAALDLRRTWAGRPASRWLSLQAPAGAAARQALVRGPEGLLARLDLERAGEHVLRGREGRRLVLAVADGGVSVAEAGCRHLHCLRQGRVSRVGERLLCAPAGLLVELEA